MAAHPPAGAAPSVLEESTLSLAQAARLVPAGRGGRPTHFSTLLRWVTRGVKAPSGQTVRLEALRLGGRWLTSRQAIARFSQRLTPAPQAPLPPRLGLRQRDRACERAAAELGAAGI